MRSGRGEKAGIDLTYSLVPLMDMHSNSDEVKSMNSLLGFLAFVLIFTAAMNYVLIVISTLINRTKEVAVHKCYGASDKNLFGMIMSETCLHMLISLLLAAFLIVLFRTKTEELLGNVGSIVLDTDYCDTDRSLHRDLFHYRFDPDLYVPAYSGGCRIP